MVPGGAIQLTKLAEPEAVPLLLVVDLKPFIKGLDLLAKTDGVPCKE